MKETINYKMPIEVVKQYALSARISKVEGIIAKQLLPAFIEVHKDTSISKSSVVTFAIVIPSRQENEIIDFTISPCDVMEGKAHNTKVVVHDPARSGSNKNATYVEDKNLPMVDRTDNLIYRIACALVGTEIAQEI